MEIMSVMIAASARKSCRDSTPLKGVAGLANGPAPRFVRTAANPTTAAAPSIAQRGGPCKASSTKMGKMAKERFAPNIEMAGSAPKIHTVEATSKMANIANCRHHRTARGRSGRCERVLHRYHSGVNVTMPRNVPDHHVHHSPIGLASGCLERYMISPSMVLSVHETAAPK